jgi:hypothetical protein
MGEWAKRRDRLYGTHGTNGTTRIGPIVPEIGPTDRINTRSHSPPLREALRSRPRRRPRPRIRPRGVMEYWSVGVLRRFGIAPHPAGLRMLSGRSSRHQTQG